MAEESNPKEMVSFEQLLKATSMQIDALYQLLIEKGIITHNEFFDKLSAVQLEGHPRNLINLNS